MDQAMKTAVEANRQAIMALIESSGPQEFIQIWRECKEQAFSSSDGNEQSVRDALDVLVKQGALFEDDSDGVTVWDLVDIPWDKVAWPA